MFNSNTCCICKRNEVPKEFPEDDSDICVECQDHIYLGHFEGQDD